MKTNWKNILLYIVKFIELLITGAAVTTKRMKTNWKNILLYIVKFIELLITGAAGGAIASM